MQEIETTTPAAARGQSAQMVWDAILELHNAEKRINRQAISALTGLRPTIVDDHVERLRDAPAMARHGFGVCQQEKHPGVVYSGEWSRICLRFDPLPAAEVAKRQAWIESKRVKA